MTDPADMHPFWLGREPLCLASASGTRRALLVAAGIPVTVCAPDVDERATESALGDTVDAATVAQTLATAKALAVARRRPGHVLGADQTLECAGRRFHKPATCEAATEVLAFLSGRPHRLHSAAALAQDGRIVWSHVETAELSLRPLSRDFIGLYLASIGDAALASVGSYRIEAEGLHLFERVSGDHTTILGLPMLPLLDALRRLGLVAA